MLSIYVMHNETLCVKKSYLKRFFFLNENLLKDFVIIKKGEFKSSTDLLCFKSMPRVFKYMIKESFGSYGKERNIYYQHPYRLTKYLIIKINELQKEIDNLNTSHGIN